MPVIIGTSGWQYRDWRGRFYPEDVVIARWLEHFAAHFQSVEVNSAFYRLPEADTFCRWRDTVPRDFVFALKASRYLTHIRRLKDPQEPGKDCSRERRTSTATLDLSFSSYRRTSDPIFAPWTGRCSASPLSEWPSNHDTTHGSPRRLKHVSRDP